MEQESTKEPIMDKERKEEREELEDEEFEPVDKKIPDKKKNSLDYMVQLWFDNYSAEHELEVRFGTKGIKYLTKIDYDNVVRRLKSNGFSSNNDDGEYSLRVNNQFIDKKSGQFAMSNIRAEINSAFAVKKYCQTNDIGSVGHFVKFTNKKSVYVESGRVFPVDFSEEFNFRVSMAKEERVAFGVQNNIKQNWAGTKKTFRYMNRVSFRHPDYPVVVDMSLVKYGNRKQGQVVPVSTLDESNVFNNSDVVEIEIELENERAKALDPKAVVVALRQVIKLVLSGLQDTNYPISYTEQREVMGAYMRLAIGEFTHVDNKHFIGPNSISLQLENVVPLNENSMATNVRLNYTVTDKADGDRRLLYVNKLGKIYMVSPNMNIIFTGAKTANRECFDSIIDGELISRDKRGAFLNLYAAFDIYFYKKRDVRALALVDKDANKSRLQLLKRFMGELVPAPFVASEVVSPITIASKEFHYGGETIFESCDKILSRVREGLFPYNTDGLIFTPMDAGVGADRVGASSKTKTTWIKSFKWKPPAYNTIDFLVTTVKDGSGADAVKHTLNGSHKVVQLRCSFIPAEHGYVNPCQELLNKEKEKDKDNDDRQPIPAQFYPTNPYDDEAGLCNVALKIDDFDAVQMFTEEGEAFIDNTIVEFSYDMTKEKGWRWTPLRVRYDKTADMLQGKRNFGNAYHVANDNWKSIHHPITEEMLSFGKIDEPENLDGEVYYNNKTKRFRTEHLKSFHNHVKKRLIQSVSHKGDMLIDYACGKAGDLQKWIGAQLSFVFGVDVHRDNLEHKLDGACARVLDARKKLKHMPDALFVCGDSSLNLKDGSAFVEEKARQIVKAVFGEGVKAKLGLKQFGIAADGFHISSCQFAVHYFFKSPDILMGFLRNVAECTRLNGYFIGTAYDGQTIFNLLRKKDLEQITEDGDKMWSVAKRYEADEFENDSSSIGYQIDVYQDSINKTFPEYLVHFEYFRRVLNMYGFDLIDRQAANAMGLPDGSGMFSELVDADTRMSKNEKKISFLNRYFVFQKMRQVNYDKVRLELSEYEEKDKNEVVKVVANVVEEKVANEVAGNEVVANEVVEKEKKKPKKLTRKKLVIE